MGNERLPVDEEAIVVRVEDHLEVVARERADRVLRLPEAHRHELGAVLLVTLEDVEAQVPGSRPGSAAAGLFDVLEIRVGVLALGPAAPRTGDHTRFKRPAAASYFATRPRLNRRSCSSKAPLAWRFRHDCRVT